MKYAINNFVFDTDQLLLMRAGEVVGFRLNEAKLLALLLSEPHKLFSKEEILDNVWAGKVVAEQAVFQNIRNLRALFGEDAIKTFSKKGYQWQLPVTPVNEELAIKREIDSSTPAIQTATPGAIKSAAGKMRAGILVASLLLLALTVGWQTQQRSATLPKLALVPFSLEAGMPQALGDQLADGLQTASAFEPVVFKARPIPRDFLLIPQQYFQSITQSTQAPYVFMGVVNEHAGGLRIRYLLKSRNNSWRAEHQAPDAARLAMLINNHIGLILHSGLLEIDEQNTRLLEATLKLLQSQHPQDLNLQKALIDVQTRAGDAASGTMLAKALQENAARQQDELFLAKGYLAEASTYIYENLLADAEVPLAKAEAGFQALNDWDGLATVERERISAAFTNHDFDQVQQHVQRAVEWSRRAGDMAQEYRLNTWAAVLANKFGRDEERWAYLDKARAILDKHGSAPELYALIHFYAGMFEKDPAAAETQYRKVLALLPADQQWWEHERAQVHLSEMLIQQARWQDALDLYADQPRGAVQELQLGKIRMAQQQWQQAEQHGVISFNAATQNDQLQSALDAALYLLQLDKHQHKPMNNFYRQFLLKEANNVPHWIAFNAAPLAEVGLELKAP